MDYFYSKHMNQYLNKKTKPHKSLANVVFISIQTFEWLQWNIVINTRGVREYSILSQKNNFVIYFFGIKNSLDRLQCDHRYIMKKEWIQNYVLIMTYDSLFGPIAAIYVSGHPSFFRYLGGTIQFQISKILVVCELLFLMFL